MIYWQRPTITQKQLYTKLVISADHDEEVRCPFCHHNTTGKWDMHYLYPITRCNHFMGFAAGKNGLPTAIFEGILED